MSAQEHQRRAAQVQLIAERMILTALRWDEDAFGAAWLDMQEIRENDLEKHGCSDLLFSVVRTLAASAAGAFLDIEESNGGDIESAEMYLLETISQRVAAGGKAVTE